MINILALWRTRGAAVLAVSMVSSTAFYGPAVLAATSESPAASVAACPSQDFNEFLKRFANDIQTQKAFVTTPLQNEFIDPDAQPEPRPVIEHLERSQLMFPLMPSEQQQRDEGLTLEKQLGGPDQAMIKLTKADTGYQRLMYFKRAACWTLYRIQDESL